MHILHRLYSKNCPLLDSHQKEDTQTQNKTRQNYLILVDVWGRR